MRCFLCISRIQLANTSKLNWVEVDSLKVIYVLNSGTCEHVKKTEKGFSKCNRVKALEEWAAILGCIGSSRDVVSNLRRRKQGCRRPERGEETRP